MTVKRIVLFSFLIIMMCTWGTGSVSAQLRLGYVDSQKILANYQPAIDASKKLESERTTIIQELQKMEEEIRSTQQTLEQQSLLLSEEKKRQKTQEIQDMIIRLQQQEQEKNQELARRQQELLAPVYESINEAIGKIRETGNYDFILDAAALLDAKEEYDITDTILKELGAEVPPKTAEKK